MLPALDLFFCPAPAAPEAPSEAQVARLPPALQGKVRRYTRASDRWLRWQGARILDRLQTQEDPLNQRLHPLSCSVSYCSRGLIVAASRSGPVGVDLESIVPLELDLYRNYCSEAEWQFISGAEDPLRAFYSTWTRKEAVLKACGTGLHNELHRLDTTGDSLDWEGRSWLLQKVPLPDQLVAHVATSGPALHLRVHTVEPEV